jgi:hypothetical protein
LALDGGGIRGYYAARLLELLLNAAGGDAERDDCGTAFDLVVGTSTGSLIGTALAAGVPLTRISTLYRDHGAAIFPSPAPTGAWNLAWCASHWRRASANANALRRELETLFGNVTLGELHARRGIALCVTATDLRTARPRVFATPHAAAHGGSADLPLVDACIASCSAPMLLPPMRPPVVGDEGALWCDGGLWATSPVEVALAEALAMTADDRPIEMLSVGTCAMPVPAAVLARPPGTGIGLWIRGLRALQVTGDAQAAAAVGLVRRLIPQLRRPVRFVRLHDPEPTDADASIVRLDHATPAAFAVMERLARRGAELNGATGDSAGADRDWLLALLRPAVGAKLVGIEDAAASGR